MPILTDGLGDGDRFVDLFCGGANVICEIPIANKVAFDSNKYIIALWKELQRNGMENIPVTVPEEMYHDVKKSYIDRDGMYEDYVIGYVGTCASFGGAWFNGYARFNPKKNEDHIKEAYRGLKKQVESFKHLDTTEFICDTYLNFVPSGNDVVYCDPPYASTKKYESDFDNEAFWAWVRENDGRSKRMYVSEYQAPSDFRCIWEKGKKDGMAATKQGDKQNTKIERLFVHER